jgi:hypothetical protein
MVQYCVYNVYIYIDTYMQQTVSREVIVRREGLGLFWTGKQVSLPKSTLWRLSTALSCEHPQFHGLVAGCQACSVVAMYHVTVIQS